MRSSSVSFVEAVEQLAEQVGLEVSRQAGGTAGSAARSSGAGRRPAAVADEPLPAQAAPRLTPSPQPVRDDLPGLLRGYQAALPGSRGERYLKYRRIPLDLAQGHGLGYAAPGTWPGRDWKGGRLVVPHTDPDGRLISFYGRAVGTDEYVHKLDRHDHLPGNKAYFNAPALREGDGAAYVVEGAFDALAFMAAGVSRTVAIFGKYNWRWDWARDVAELVIAFDVDADATKQARELARQAVLHGRRVLILPPETYGSCKDAAAAWAAGELALDGEPGAPSLADRQAEWAERAALRAG